jgi:hypothetical protein
LQGSLTEQDKSRRVWRRPRAGDASDWIGVRQCATGSELICLDRRLVKALAPAGHGPDRSLANVAGGWSMIIAGPTLRFKAAALPIARWKSAIRAAIHFRADLDQLFLQARQRPVPVRLRCRERALPRRGFPNECRTEVECGRPMGSSSSAVIFLRFARALQTPIVSVLATRGSDVAGRPTLG